MTETTKNTTSRRAVTQGLAWSVPAVAAASAAPAMAATTAPLPNGEEYYANAQAYATETAYDDGDKFDRCPAPGESSLQSLGGFVASPEFPERGGFSVDHAPGTAPGTATINGPLHYVVAYPIEMFNPVAGTPNRNFFQTTLGSANWSGPEVYQTTMTDPSGTTGTYVIVDYTYTGSLTNQTLEYGTTSWPNTELEFRLKSGYHNADYCKPTNGTTFRGGFYGDGFTGAESDWTTPVAFDVNNGEYAGTLPIINGDGWYEFVRNQPNSIA